MALQISSDDNAANAKKLGNSQSLWHEFELVAIKFTAKTGANEYQSLEAI